MGPTNSQMMRGSVWLVLHGGLAQFSGKRLVVPPIYMKGGGSNDEDIPTKYDTSNVKNSSSNIKYTNQGPLTRCRAKKLQEHVNSFLTNYAFMTPRLLLNSTKPKD